MKKSVCLWLWSVSVGERCMNSFGLGFFLIGRQLNNVASKHRAQQIQQALNDTTVVIISGGGKWTTTNQHRRTDTVYVCVSLSFFHFHFDTEGNCGEDISMNFIIGLNQIHSLYDISVEIYLAIRSKIVEQTEERKTIVSGFWCQLCTVTSVWRKTNGKWPKTTL